jgi:YVTN family beta-propeller protein
MKLHQLLSVSLMLAASSAMAGTVYVTNEKDNTVSVIDTATGEVTSTINVGKRPRGIGLSPDQKNALCCC